MKKEKYLQIFNYLLEFSKLRTNPVRDIQSSDTQYPEVLWFADIPQYEIFDCITFPTYNQDADYWLKIKKPKEEPLRPTFPKISKVLTEWIVEESLILPAQGWYQQHLYENVRYRSKAAWKRLSEISAKV